MADTLPSQNPIPPPTLQTATLTTANGRLVKAVTDQLFSHVVPAGAEYFLFDDSQNGAIIGFEMSTNGEHTNLQIIVYNDNPTVPNYINNFHMHELLSLGRGLTPGEVQILPNGQSQDIPGRPSSVYPYLARFKFDTIPDFTSQFGMSHDTIPADLPVLVIKYEPTIPQPYKRIVATIFNSDPFDDITIYNLDIKRIVYQDLLPGEAPLPPSYIEPSNVRRTVALPTSTSQYGFNPNKKKPVYDEPMYTDS